MKLFNTDPNNGLQAARAALAQTEDRIRHLEGERAQRLDGGDYLGEVAKIDREIASLHGQLAAHHDRITVLEQNRLEFEQNQREKQRAASIDQIRKLLPARQTAAERLDAALRATAAAFAALGGASDPRPGSVDLAFGADCVEAECGRHDRRLSAARPISLHHHHGDGGILRRRRRSDLMMRTEQMRARWRVSCPKFAEDFGWRAPR